MYLHHPVVVALAIAIGRQVTRTFINNHQLYALIKKHEYSSSSLLHHYKLCMSVSSSGGSGDSDSGRETVDNMQAGTINNHQ